jgi:hypothetical protein
VVKLGEAAEPPPTQAEIQEVTFGECEGAVEAHLGGERAGVGFGVSHGSP